MRTRVQECVECVVEEMQRRGHPSPCNCEDADDYEDEVIAFAETAWGPLDAAQRSSICRWARDDWREWSET